MEESPTPNRTQSFSNGDATSKVKNGGGPCVVFCHIGTSIKYGKHMVYAVRQARAFNPDSRIFLISQPKIFFENADSRKILETLQKLRVTIVPLKRLEKDASLAAFRKFFILSGNMAVGKNSGNKQFNKVTIERFFYVHALMKLYNLKDVFHLENDNLIYIDIGLYARNARECSMSLGVQARELLDPKRPKRQFLIAGTVYIKDTDALRMLLKYIISTLQKGVKYLHSRLGHHQINDMSLMALYYLEKGKHENRISILPENPDVNAPNQYNWNGRDKVQKCLLERRKLVFDNAAISIWNSGTFQSKKPFVAKTMKSAWFAYTRVDARKYKLIWTQKCYTKQACNCPAIIGIKGTEFEGKSALVASLHMHSKILEPYLSKCSHP